MENIFSRAWWIPVLRGLPGLASIVFGALVFARPDAGALALVWLVSLYAFVTGALLLALGLRMRALGRAGAARQERRVLPDRRMAPARWPPPMTAADAALW